MQIYQDQDADLSLLEGRTIAVIGYGNQGRAQALNLRDSGLDVIIGNRQDDYAQQAREDGFTVHPIDQAVVEADVMLLLIPDEVAPDVFQEAIEPQLDADDVLVFSSGYNIAFDCLTPPPRVDVVLVAPRMIGAGVRDLYMAGEGFPSFIGVSQDHSGRAKALALAVAKGIGSTRAGVVEVTFAQEAELDLFTEQCFGPAFGSVLTTAVDLLLEEGYPPEAVLLELYMSGEFAYTLAKIAELGMVEQSQLHSRTSQYGSMSRGMRFRLPELREKMMEGLEEIRSGAFAEEWAAEQEEGSPTLEMLRESARAMPLYELEQELRAALHGSPQPYLAAQRSVAAASKDRSRQRGLLDKATTVLKRVTGRLSRRQEDADGALPPLNAQEMGEILTRFVDLAASDAVLASFASGRDVTTHYVLTDLDLTFYLCFRQGDVTGAMEAPPTPAEVKLTTTADILDGMFTGRVNAARAAMSGKISFEGDTRLAMSVQRAQKDLGRIYRQARK
jgi:ketol-acid reductoisomerase